MDFLNVFLARLFDSFKASSPKLASIIILILGVFLYAAQNGLSDLVGVDLSNVVQWVVFLLAALTGSRTTKVLTENKAK